MQHNKYIDNSHFKTEPPRYNIHNDSKYSPKKQITNKSPDV